MHAWQLIHDCVVSILKSVLDEHVMPDATMVMPGFFVARIFITNKSDAAMLTRTTNLPSRI